tara:strand:+ start:229 stop:1263 length:1035 start_codon:yes stop_codon:yes gene_type:complete
MGIFDQGADKQILTLGLGLLSGQDPLKSLLTASNLDQKKSRFLTDEEKKAIGINDNELYQIDANGQISRVTNNQESILKGLDVEKTKGEIERQGIEKREKEQKFRGQFADDLGKKENFEANTSRLIKDVEDAITLIEDYNTAGFGNFLQALASPITGRGKKEALLANILERIKNNVFLTNLIESKKEGATFGSLTENEGRKISEAFGKISQINNKSITLNSLREIGNSFKNKLDIDTKRFFAKYKDSDFLDGIEERPLIDFNPDGSNAIFDENLGRLVSQDSREFTKIGQDILKKVVGLIQNGKNQEAIDFLNSKNEELGDRKFDMILPRQTQELIKGLLTQQQ